MKLYIELFFTFFKIVLFTFGGGWAMISIIQREIVENHRWIEKEDFLEQCYRFEKRRGLDRITKAVNNAMKINDDDSYIVQYIRDHTPENAVVFLTGIGKCYPILRSHKVLNNLHQAFVRVPVVMFFPGTYDEQELVLFNEIKDDNYYRAFRLVK